MNTTFRFQNSCDSGLYKCLKLVLPSLALLLVFASLVPGTALATSSRTSALGGDNTFIEDDNNVLRWYASLPEYGNQISLGTGHHDLSNNDYSWGDALSGFSSGIHFNLDSKATWGTAALYFNEFIRDSDVSTSTREDAENSFMVILARSLGPVEAGLSVRHGGREYSVAIDTVGGRPLTHRDHSSTTVGLGIRADLSETSYVDAAIDLHRVQWNDFGFDHRPGLDDTYINISLRTRGFVAVGTTMALVPAVEYWSEDSLHKNDSYILPMDSKDKMFRLGCGLNYFPNSDNFLLLSAEYRDASNKILDNSGWATLLNLEVQQLNLLLATETRWNHWLTLRSSAGVQFIDGSYETPDHEFPLSFGAGIHVAGFDLDMAIASHEPGILAPNWQIDQPGEPFLHTAGSWFSANLRYLF